MVGVQEGNVLDFTAPVGGVERDGLYMIEGLCVLALEDAAEAATFSGFIGSAVVSATFAADGAVSQGARAYLNDTTHGIESIASATNYPIGSFAAALAGTEAVCHVRLDGVSTQVYGVPGDIQGVTASTGLTGGGTSGTVTVALSAASIASLGLADSAVQPGAVLTDGTLPVVNADGELVDSSLTDTDAATLTDGSDATALHVHTDLVGDSGAGGVAGFVPAPAAGDAAAGKYLDADGTWTVPPDTDTTYSDFTGDSGAGGVAGLVPAPGAGDAAAGKYLDADGTWTVPPTSSAADAVLGDQARRSTTTAQTTTTSTPLKITFETSEVAGDVTYLSGDFTVPEDGVYAVAASLTFATSAGGTARKTYIYVDGAAFEDADAGADGSNPVTVAASAIAYLAASSVIAIYGEQDSGGDLDVTAGRVAVQRVQ